MAKGSFGLIICILNLIFEAAIVFTQSVPASQVCIIGAGSSGLATARYMRELGLNFKIFEATRHIGGVWRFDPRVGTDEDGLPMFPTSYKNMRANGVLETLEYAGFPFPKGLRSFPSATCINKYLRSFTNHFNLRKYIQFQSLVTNVQWTEDKWNVTYMRTDTRKNASESCDFVVVASGEYSAPNVPHFRQQEEFKGKIIHSIDYKDSEDFRDLRVLVVGAGPTGLDVVAGLINVTSTTLHSHHFTGELQEIPGNYVKKPDIKHFTLNGAVFVDDSNEEFDTVILCTASQVCIIGAGSSGLATARYMRELGLNFKIFEATRHIGGVWRFDPRVGTDEYGLPMFPTSYKNMRANGVLETLEYVGFPFPKGIRSFPSASCINKYLRSFTNHFNLKKYIQFQSLVTNVQWTEDKWNVTYMRTDTRKNASESCDFVVVASGEFSAPNVPHFKQQEEFKGKIIHSIDFKDSEDFRDLRLLVIGVGPSGLDVVAELINVTSTTLHSHHFMGELQEVPGNYVKKPDIKHFTQTGAVFVDDSTEEFDTVILCTGYTFNLPFLDYKSAGVAATKKYVMPLYNQVVNINHPSMTFVGFGKHSIGVVHDKQAHYSAQLAAARIKLPSQEVMLEHWFNQTRNINITNINVIGYLATNQYLEALLKDTNIDRASPIILKIIIDILTYWQISFLNFRDYEYQVLSDTQFVKTYKLMKEVCPIDT